MAEANVQGKRLNILLLGKTGHGKSATGNSIIGEEVFRSEPGAKSVTRECEISGNTVDGYHMTIVDTPGTMDTRNADNAIMTLAIAICQLNNSIDAVMIVLNYSTRMTDEEKECVDRLKQLFGKEIVDFIVVIFTHGDNYEKAMKRKNDLRPFDRYLRENGGAYLGDFLKECSYRYVLIDNYAEGDDAKTQISKIVKMIVDMRAQNNGRRYSNTFWHRSGTENRKQIDDNIFTDELTPEEKEDLVEKLQQIYGSDIASLKPEKFAKLRKSLKGNYDFKNADDTAESSTRQVTPILPLEEDIKKIYDEMSHTTAECFPSEALLTVPSVGCVKMKELQVGDKVVTLSSDQSPCQTEVYLFGHSLEGCKATFICLKTKNHLLKITGGHYVFTSANEQVITKAAKEVLIGDKLLTLNEGRYVPEEVADIWQSQEAGLYAPFTLSGSIVVDGVLASCYVDVLPPEVAHSLLWPVRHLYKMSPSTLTAISKTGNDGIPKWIRWCLDNVLSV